MNRLGYITLIALASYSCAQPPAQSTNFEQDIRRELNALGRAIVQRDTGAIDRLVADDFTFTQPDAIVSGKKEMLSATKSEVFAYEQHEVVEIKVRGYGLTAVSNGQFMVGARYKGQPISHRVQFTSIHVHKGGHWQLVALHSTITGE